METASDSVRINSQIKLVKYLLNRNIDSAKVLANDVLKKLEEDNYSSLSFRCNKAEIINYLGIIDAKQGKMEKALSKYLRALNISRDVKDSTLTGLTLHNLGMFYRRQNQYQKAKQYFNEAIAIKESINDEPDNIAMSYNMLGVTYFYEKQYDSALVNYIKAKNLYTTELGRTKVNGNMALLFSSLKEFKKAINVFQENIRIFERLGVQNELSTAYLNLAASYNGIGDFKSAISRLDSAISISKKRGYKELLQKQYLCRSLAQKSLNNFEQALNDYTTYKLYNDSLNDINQAKRITTLEITNKFEREKLQSELELQAERVEKRWYFSLLIVTLALGTCIFVLIRKNTKIQLAITARKLQNEELQRKTTEQILEFKEAELKNEFLKSQIRQEYQVVLVNELKNILNIEQQQCRDKAIKSLIASLHSKKIDNQTDNSLNAYLDKVSPDFRIKLNNHFLILNEKEKNLLCLMKLGLSTNEIKDLQNISLASVKSTRYRIRKKLQINSEDDIVAWIDDFNTDK
ncbi:hypothetical protein GCM10023163_03120 [Aestuariibaculum suncheonense]